MSASETGLDAAEFNIEYFRQRGFRRKRCKSCGAYFWTLGESEYCGEPPCVEYTFLGDSPMTFKGDVHAVRESFLSFMEAEGHKRITRYPVVARWREDVFFVQASIYDFQPWVLNGSVKPPANPLTMSQPCVRFNDIDNVGKTGRHFTLFEMMTHTAFNTKDEWHYFKDRTVELCQRYFNGKMGVAEELLTYKEAEWEGGGNSGPCFEVLIKGSEVATLVFMMYTGSGPGKVPMPMQVVDTGYGLERITWVASGSPSAYEAVFGHLLEELRGELQVETNDKVLQEYSRIAGLMDARTPGAIIEIRERVAGRMGISIERLLKLLLPLENLYVALDHTRALAFMLHDGVMPSNVRQGYFARLLIRRALRALDALGGRITLHSLVERQIDYWKKDFSELQEEKEDILHIVGVEESKYRETVSRGRALVRKLEEQGAIGTKELVDLYESHGITPDQVSEFATKPVEVPDDFYARIAEGHSSEAVVERKEELLLPDLPPTVRLYYSDQYRTEFQATVLFSDEKHVVLDATCFYPQGGGQDPDTGYIGGRHISDVQLHGNIVVHTFEGRPFAAGESVSCSVDRERRMDLMRHHTATHIVLAAARGVLGNHVWQAGAHKEQREARLDITHYASPSQEELERIEELANGVIMDDRPVKVRVMERNEAESAYGFRLYQGGVVPGREIRVVTIQDWDVEACAGTHCERTGEVGLVKIKSAQRIQDGVIRLTFVAGQQALLYFQQLQSMTGELRKLLNSDEYHLLESVKRQREEIIELNSRLSASARTDMENEAATMLENAVMKEGVRFVIARIELDAADMRKLARKLTSQEMVVAILLGSGGQLVIARSKDAHIRCNELMSKIIARAGGSGGGREEYAQGKIGREDIQLIREIVLT
ncbi:MAG: alanine--tRNA ligase [Methanomassiliicoccales archaeon]